MRSGPTRSASATWYSAWRRRTSPRLFRVEPLAGVLAHRLEHPEAGIATGFLLAAEQAVVEQAGERLELRLAYLLDRRRGCSRLRTRRAARTAPAGAARAAGSSSRSSPAAPAGAAGRSRPPPLNSSSGRPIRARICSGVSSLTRAAASSSASGSPSSCLQIAETAPAFASVSTKLRSSARARATNTEPSRCGQAPRDRRTRAGPAAAAPCTRARPSGAAARGS